MSAIAALAERLHQLDAAQMPTTLVEVARQRVFDSAAAFVAGAGADESRLSRRVLDAERGQSRSALEPALRFACAATRCTEVDDIYIPGCATEGAVVVPVALLVAAADAHDDRQVLGSVVAGYEAMSALARGIDGASIIYTGVWTTYFAAPFGAAAVAARLLGLSAEQTAHALAIAASRCVGTTGRIVGSASSRWWTVGCAAVDGYLSARAAQQGMIGDLSILERSLAASSPVGFDAAAFRGTGDGWAILDVDTKPYRAGRQGLSAIEAYRSLGAARTPELIDGITVGVPRQVRSVLDQPGGPGGGLRQGLQYTLAVLTYAPDQVWQIERPSAAASDERLVSSLAARIRIDQDDELSAAYPWRWGARVQVTLADGSQQRAEVLDPRGSARNAYDWSELVDKHRRLAAAGQSEATEPTWLTRLHGLCRSFGNDPQAQTSRALLAGLPGADGMLGDGGGCA